MKRYHDEQFKHTKMLIKSLAEENQRQLSKWGVQSHTLPEWLMYLTEEVGELAKAISEFMYRGGKSGDIYDEAIQAATLAVKIAEMIETQEWSSEFEVYDDKCPKCGHRLTMWFSNYIDKQWRFCRNIGSCDYSETRPIPEAEKHEDRTS